MSTRRNKAGTGCVLERPSKQHGAVFQIRWRINGGPARYETIGPDRQEADEALALKLAEVNRGTYRERRQASLHEFASGWFSQHREGLKPSAVERLRNDLEVHVAKKGISREVVEEMSKIKGEPDWMLQKRLKSYEIFMRKPIPTWGVDLSGLSFDDLVLYSPPTAGR